MARQFSKEVPLMFYCDFHGHSKRYGYCVDENFNIARMCLCMEIQMKMIQSNREYFLTFCPNSLLPSLTSLASIYLTSSISLRFVVQKSKVSTARVTMWKELNINLVYTIEASFLGPSTTPAIRQTETVASFQHLLGKKRRSSFSG